MAKGQKFKDVVYVTIEDAGPDEWLSAHFEQPNKEHGGKVGVYQLVAVKTSKVTRELV